MSDKITAVDAEYDEAMAHLIKHAREVASGFEPGAIAGHFVMAWDKNGQFSVGWDLRDDGPGPRMTAALVREVASEIREKEHVLALLESLE